MNKRGDNSGIIATIIVIGFFLFVGLVGNESEPKCIKSGCDNDQAEGSSYCYLHKLYSGRSTNKSNSSSYSSGSSSSKSSSTSSTSSGTSSSSSSRNKKSYTSNPYSSYDEGYEDVYDGEDYDWDRYWEDDDYADGVDDAMDDLDW